MELRAIIALTRSWSLFWRQLSSHSAGPLATEGVNRTSSGSNLATMRYASRYEVFFSSSDRNVFTVDGQRVAALHDEHVFVIIVDMFRGSRVLIASPECHLASVHSIKHVAFHTWRCLF